MSELEALATALGATDLFVLRRVADCRYAHLGGLGRGAGWAGITELNGATDVAAHTLLTARVVRQHSPQPHHVFGPYWACEVASVQVSRDDLVIFGAAAPSQRLRAGTAERLTTRAETAAQTVRGASPAKSLADELEVLHAVQRLASQRPQTVAEAMETICEIAADALSCDAALLSVLGRPTARASRGWEPDEYTVAACLRELRIAPDEPRCVQDATSGGLMPGATGVRSFLTVPIGEHPVGVLLLVHAVPHERGFTSLCQQLGSRLAEVADMQLATAALYEENSRARNETAALADAHREMTDALDAMPRSITLVHVERDSQGAPSGLHVAWANAHVRRTLGKRLEQIRDSPFELTFPAVAARYLQHYLEIAAAGQARQFPDEWFSGEHIRGSFSTTVTPWGANGLLIDVIDVTQQQEALSALRVSERRLRAAQEQAGLAAWDWDLATGAVSWSPLMFAIMGVQPDAHPSPELTLSLMHPEDHDHFVEIAKQALKAENTLEADFRVIRSNGTVSHIHTAATVERDPDGLAVSVWGTNQDLTAHRSREQALTDAAHQDALTGLLNRRGWERQTAAALPTPLTTAVAMLDLDHFKALNDREGHAAGDELLRLCASRWSTRLRSGDILARIGGEEFAILLPGCDLPQAQRLLDGLRALIPTPMTASAGVTILAADEPLEAALGRADLALYAAKSAGRDRTTQSEI